MAKPTVRRLFRSSNPTRIDTRATVFNISRAPNSTSRQVSYADDFLALAGTGGAQIVIPTPYNIPKLFEMIEQSNMLQQCIDAYCTNTVMTGWEIEPVVRGRDIDQGEQNELQSFIDHANSEESLSTVMDKTIRDRESVGFGFLEVIRDASGNISILRNAPALFTRLCVKHPDDVLVTYDIPRGRRTTSVQEWRKFRRYIQIVNGQRIWFKEFGDPRKMDCTNGAYSNEPGYDPNNPEATEIFHFKNPSNDVYGIPRWITQIPSIIGSRESEEVNMRYFQDNTVPPMFLLVSGGRLTQQSYAQLHRTLNEGDLGSDRQNKIMLLEAIGEGDSMDGKASPIDIKVEKLAASRQSDGLFKQYDEGNMAKVRSSFRLPPVVVGMAQDATFATANVSAFIAENQVFGPARGHIDETMNKQLISGRAGLQLRTCKLVSRTPIITSPDMVVKCMTALNVMGAVTPRSAQELANKMLQIELTPYPKKDAPDWEEWMDRPIQFAQRGMRGAAYDEGAQDLANAIGPDVDAQGEPIQNPDDYAHGDQEPAGGPAITPTGKLPSTHGQAATESTDVKKTQQSGQIAQTAPKNGEQ